MSERQYKCEGNAYKADMKDVYREHREEIDKMEHKYKRDFWQQLTCNAG